MLVIDASAVVAALVEDGPHGRWAETVMAREPLDASVATLDSRLATAIGPQCSFELPPDRRPFAVGL